jgi:hypothetical protein
MVRKKEVIGGFARKSGDSSSTSCMPCFKDRSILNGLSGQTTVTPYFQYVRVPKACRADDAEGP